MSTPLDTLKRLRAEYPTPLNDAGKAVELLNRVAYLHRQDGWGLYSASPSQFGAKRYDGKKCKADILCQQGGSHYDCLADGEGRAEVVWREVGPTDPARFVAPIPPQQQDEPVPNPGTDPADKLHAALNVLSDLIAAQAVQNQRLFSIAERLEQLNAQQPPRYQGTVSNPGWLGGKRAVELEPK